jgi:hypothetical protein
VGALVYGALEPWFAKNVLQKGPQGPAKVYLDRYLTWFSPAVSCTPPMPQQLGVVSTTRSHRSRSLFFSLCCYLRFLSNIIP